MTAPKVPTNPDGTPNFGVLSGTPSGSGGVTIWDVPADVAAILTAMGSVDHNKRPIFWFDTGHKKVTKTTVSGIPGVTEPGLLGADGGQPEFGSANSAEHYQEEHSKTSSHREAYDIMRRPEQVMAQFYAMQYNDPARFMALQKALASGPWGTVHLNGVFDHSTEAALGQAMLMYIKGAMGAGVAQSFTSYLLKTGATAQSLGGDGTSLGTGTRAPFQASVTDPAQIRAAAEQAFQAATGRGASEKQLNAFVSQFQAAQTSAEQANYNGTGTVTAPDLTSQAGQFAQQQDPQAYKQHQATSYTNALVNLLMGSPQRPDIQPVAKA